MRKVVLLFIIIITAVSMYAQPRATEGTTDFQRTKQPAAIIELPYAQSIIEKAIEEYMLKKGAKGSDNRDFIVYRNHKLSGNHDYYSDCYFKVERKSRKDKDISVVYLITCKTGSDLKLRNSSDDNGLSGARELLEDLVPAVEAYSLEVQIKDQEELIKKLNGKISGLVEDSIGIDKKKKALDEKMQQNIDDRQKQKTEAEKQQAILEAMKGKRKS